MFSLEPRNLHQFIASREASEWSVGVVRQLASSGGNSLLTARSTSDYSRSKGVTYDDDTQTVSGSVGGSNRHGGEWARLCGHQRAEKEGQSRRGPGGARLLQHRPARAGAAAHETMPPRGGGFGHARQAHRLAEALSPAGGRALQLREL